MERLPGGSGEAYSPSTSRPRPINPAIIRAAITDTARNDSNHMASDPSTKEVALQGKFAILTPRWAKANVELPATK